MGSRLTVHSGTNLGHRWQPSRPSVCSRMWGLSSSLVSSLVISVLFFDLLSLFHTHN